MIAVYIMWVVMYTILPILYFVLRNMTKPKKNITLGVTLPYKAQSDAGAEAIITAFKRRMNLVFLLMTLAAVPCLFVRSFSVGMTLALTWTLLCIFIPFIPYVLAHRRLQALKAERGWNVSGTNAVFIDTKAASETKKPVSAVWFLPPLLLTLVSVADGYLKGGDKFLFSLLVYGTFALLVVMFYAIYRLNLRQPAEAVDAETVRTQALTRVRQYHWTRCLVCSAWLTGLLSMSMWVFDSFWGFIISTLVYTGALLTVVLQSEFRVRHHQERLTEQSGQDIYLDDDRHWPLGMFYWNPDDSHTMKNDRVGIGMTVNLAKRGMQVFAVFIALVLLTIPLWGVWMIYEESSPIEFTIADGVLTARQATTTYTIPLGEIRTAVLLEKLPEVRRVAGTAMDTILKGRYTAEGIGSCTLMLDPRTEPWIQIVTENRTYLIGENSGDETRALLDKIR